MLWFCLVQKDLDATVEVCADEYVTAAAFGTLLDDRIDWCSIGTHAVCTLTIFCIFAFELLLPRFDLSDDAVGIGSKHGTSDNGIVGLYALPKVVAITPNARKFRIVVMRLPNVDALVL